MKNSALTNRLVLGLLLGGLLLLARGVEENLPVVGRPFLPTPTAAGCACGDCCAAGAPRRRGDDRLADRRFALPMLCSLAPRPPTPSSDGSAALAKGRTAPDLLAGMPVLGDWLQGLLDQFTGDPATIRGQSPTGRPRTDESLKIIGGLQRGKDGFALIAVFFLYHGEQVLAQAPTRGASGERRRRVPVGRQHDHGGGLGLVATASPGWPGWAIGWRA
jgi:hypothetical protein